MSVKKSHSFVMRMGNDVVNFYEYGRLGEEPVGQLPHLTFFKVFGILLTPGKMYSIRAKATARPVQEKHHG